jgi:hypothetical protein
MHSSDYTSKSDPEYGEVTFHHNGDYSGFVTIVMPSDECEMALEHRTNRVNVQVPFDVIEQLVMDKLRREMVSALESMSDEDFKGYYKRIHL